MLVQQYPHIGSSSRICWRVTMCARVDTGKENQDKDKGKHNITIRLSFVTFIIYLYRDIFADIKHITVTADLPDLSDNVTELAYSMLKSFTPQKGIITIKEKNIFV